MLNTRWPEALAACRCDSCRLLIIVVLTCASSRPGRSIRRGITPRKPSAIVARASRATETGSGLESTPSERRRPSIATLGNTKGSAMLAHSASAREPRERTTHSPVAASVVTTRNAVGNASSCQPPKPWWIREEIRPASRSEKWAPKPNNRGASSSA